MELESFYCDHCGCELFDKYIGYSRQCASGDLWFCPNCKEETHGENASSHEDRD